MPLVPMRILLEASLDSSKTGAPFAIGAYNVNNMEQIQGIMKAARETQSPVIIQASRGALKYADMNYLGHLMQAAAELNPDVFIAMHLDHGNNLDSAKKAIALGFTSVMIDGSLMEDGKTASEYEYNVKVTKEVVDYAHGFGVTVEGELGTLGGIEDGVGSGKIHITDPAQVADFVKKTGVDALAIAIGTSHGAYKFKVEPKLAFDVLEIIRKQNPDLFLVLHGASSVPAELVEVVNKYGGNMKKTMGVPMAGLKKAIGLGVNKINVDTDGRIAVTGAIRKVFVEQPEKFDPRDYLGPAREAIYEVVKGKMIDFNTTGKMSTVKVRTLAEMKKIYGR